MGAFFSSPFASMLALKSADASKMSDKHSHPNFIYVQTHKHKLMHEQADESCLPSKYTSKGNVIFIDFAGEQ